MKFKPGDTVVFNIESFNSEYWDGLSETRKREYYGMLYNFNNPEDPYFFTFLAEHWPQHGKCVLVNMQNQVVETMREMRSFRKVGEDEC